MSAVAQEKGSWRATSSTAQAITGDVTLSPEKISINFLPFPISRIRSLEQGEVSAVFDEGIDAGGSGSLYRVNIPATRMLMHRNTLCAGDDTQWMITYVAGRSLRIAFFSGTALPVFTRDAIVNSTDLCGTFSYAR